LKNNNRKTLNIKEVKEMKKLIITFVALVSISALGFVGSQVWACWWGGYHGSSTEGYYPNTNPGSTYQDFLNDTAKLRQELAAKQGEYNALMAQPNPDPKKAAQLSQEIARIHDQLQTKAQAYGLNMPTPRGNYYNAPMAPYGYGGWGCWYMDRYGQGGWGCW